MNSSGTLKIARNGYIVMAVVFCALGIFLMAVPEKAVKIICVLAGILFIADGIIKIIGYFSRAGHRINDLYSNQFIEKDDFIKPDAVL